MVIYGSLGGLKCTTKENYYSAIQDARKIMDCKDFENPQEIIEYYCKYFHSKPEDFIVII